jgi:hypothetical protein
MALTYEESAALMTDAAFRGRVKVSCLKFAGSILIEADSTPAHNTRVRWATNTYQNPEMVASQTQPPTVMDPAVQDLGAEITDLALQGAVEGVINKLM